MAAFTPELQYNFDVASDDIQTQTWNNGLNLEDMDHDAGKPKNVFYQTCRNSLFDNGIDTIEYPNLLYVKPIVIPKNLITNPREKIIKEKYSMRDTEPAYKLGMQEKYTPAYYFDPATRTYPAEFPDTVKNFHGKTVNLKKYGLNIELYFELKGTKITGFTKGKPILEDTPNPSILATTITIKNAGLKDTYTEYIHKTGYTMGFTTTGNQIKIPDAKKQSQDEYNHIMSQTFILGNGEKDNFFKKYEGITETDSDYKDILLRGQRMIVYKLLGDLLHAAFATPEDFVFTLDTYLKDRCRKNKVAVVAKELNMLDVLFDKKTKLYKVWIDKLYDTDGYEIDGGTKGKRKKAPAKVLSKTGRKSKGSKELTGKETRLKEGREEVSQFLTVRSNKDIKYKKILVSSFNYHPADEMIPDFTDEVDSEQMGGREKGYPREMISRPDGVETIPKSDTIPIFNKDVNLKTVPESYPNNIEIKFPDYQTLDGLSGNSIPAFLAYIRDKIENQQKLNEDIIDKINKDEDKDIATESVHNTERVFSEGVESVETQVLNLIDGITYALNNKTDVSELLNDLMELLVDDMNMIFEGDLEIYLIRSICNDDTKALDAYNLLDSLTRDHGLFVYDYRMLNDFVTNIETIKTAVEEFENQPSENTDNTAVEEFENQPSENTGNTENVFRFPGGKNKRKTLKKRKKTKNTSSKKGRRTQRRQIKKKRQKKKEKKSKN